MISIIEFLSKTIVLDPFSHPLFCAFFEKNYRNKPVNLEELSHKLSFSFLDYPIETYGRRTQ